MGRATGSCPPHRDGSRTPPAQPLVAKTIEIIDVSKKDGEEYNAIFKVKFLKRMGRSSMFLKKMVINLAG